MALKARQRLGKYRIEARLAAGGFAEVFRAYDTVEGIRVALKVAYDHVVTGETLERFRKEVRLVAALDHPRILSLKTADIIEGHFVMVTALGIESLEDRLGRRISMRTVLDFGEQMLDALAFAHERRIVHCDLKPDNLILFPGNMLRLSDFGIARVAQRTLAASGSGTLGYMAPEQAMGRPSARSDVFSAGLILYRMMTGVLPEWPYQWPFQGLERIRKRFHPGIERLLRKALEVDPRKRFQDAVEMLAAYRAVMPRALLLKPATQRRATRGAASERRTLRLREFKKRFGKALGVRHLCTRCRGPVSEAMRFCPWCSLQRSAHRAETRFPARCPRCRRGIKLDWKYCPWCYGRKIGPLSDRTFSDKRYERRCRAAGCPRRELLPGMHYCPWCRSKVRYKWPLDGTRERCPRCRWGVAAGFWECCAWCGRTLQQKQESAR